MNLPLSQEEARLAFEVEKIDRLGYTVVERFEDGKFFIVRKINADPVIDTVKARSEMIRANGRKGGKAGQRYIGSLDPITAADLAAKSGLKIGTKEFADHAVEKIQQEYTKYKADLK